MKIKQCLLIKILIISPNHLFHVITQCEMCVHKEIKKWQNTSFLN